MESAHTPQNRGIDLGYGWVKYSKGDAHYADQQPNVEIGAFQSIVWANPTQLTIPGQSGSRTLTLRVQGTTYAVSAEPENVAPRNAYRVRGDHYIDTEQYLVCMCAAVKAMRVGSFNHLVVGTPVGNFEVAKQAILERFAHGLQFDGVEVPIKRLLVVPQPVGGLFWHMIESGRQNELLGKVRLLIDVGYGTFDWVLANGNAVNVESSGSSDFGVSKFIDAVVASIRGSTHGIGADLLLTAAVDKMITRGQSFDYAGKPQHLALHRARIDQIAIQGLQEMLSRVGSLRMISSIIVMGGGASLFARAIGKAAGTIPVEFIGEPQFANVRGFQLLAEASAARL